MIYKIKLYVDPNTNTKRRLRGSILTSDQLLIDVVEEDLPAVMDDTLLSSLFNYLQLSHNFDFMTVYQPSVRANYTCYLAIADVNEECVLSYTCY